MERIINIVKENGETTADLLISDRRFAFDVENIIGDFIAIKDYRLDANGNKRIFYNMLEHIFTRPIENEFFVLKRDYVFYYEDYYREVKRAFKCLKRALQIINSNETHKKRYQAFMELRNELNLKFSDKITLRDSDDSYNAPLKKFEQLESSDTWYSYECYSFADLVFAVLHYYIMEKYRLIKCSHCGKYTAVKTLKQKYCGRMSPYRGNSQKTYKEPQPCEQTVRDAKQEFIRKRKRILDKMGKSTYCPDKLKNIFLIECDKYIDEVNQKPTIKNLDSYDNFLHNTEKQRKWVKK